ncbi:MAG: hypothetical protein DCC43_00830 [Candidatus Brocadia sp.]|jgi:hypothetical protein|uniref:Uncharacterized protein n=1 Tax=Candidatus Brocadia fulgida TaxID=380242 RepID=A0A0M2UW13_9BACT|nr:MAG: hypothetical protein BROFUL_01019 [Candidatus Brocadia fulgida]MCC6326662.1 hypothetical protein [Candidatus Brocadia sp.]MCE7910246.1 hypothetical protein [Candidatus Brocadia sp. AMX3]MDG5997053.1 hypothetical protein [Candidatus Brocadia sp.]RIK03264.1 MAG: hypothetical protein DCC43_00830 [Candidatus Brocadia sp.]
MIREKAPIFTIPLKRIEGFLADIICFRDAKARTNHPALAFVIGVHNESRLEVWDKFLIKHEYKISKQHGENFVDVTNDSNLIHRQGNIVPGAMTVSKIILPLEIIFSELEISSVNIKFTGSAYYNERTCNLFLWQFVSNDYIQIEVKTYQCDRTIATTIILGRLKAAGKQVKEIDESTVNKKCLSRVQTYFETLGIKSNFYLQKEEYKDYTYPLAYIASLPSAEIVNQLSGQGGMINILRMDFGSYERIPITGDRGPEVKLARAKKRNTFNKIMAEIAEGLVTYYRGLAIVNPIAKFHNSKEPVIGAINKLISTDHQEKEFIAPT